VEAADHVVYPRVDHHVPVVVDVYQEDPGVGRDAGGRVVEAYVAVGGHVEAGVDNGKMEVDVGGGVEDAYDCLFQDMYGCRGNDYHV
jgi:hypothetical protein